ncbi:MAG: oligosaccharide repeat unit polymerase [Bacilli bacterium]|nr:oligosaccharide repeat unit polymerase [Bacilli bacterium]
MKIKRNSFTTFILNAILTSIIAIVILVLPNTYETLSIIGYCIILLCIILYLKHRKAERLTFLVGILIVISFCFAISVCLNPYSTAFNWQVSLIDTKANIINAKNFLLLMYIFTIFIKKDKSIDTLEPVRYNNNFLIFTVGFIILILAFYYGIDKSIIGVYSSNTNPLYEYALVVYLFCWLYFDKKWAHGALLVYAILYCGQAILYGDRSSCFPMILLNMLLLWKRGYNMKYITLIGIGGIFFGNAIDIFRNSGTLFSLDVIKEVLDRGLFVNTISYSFYGGTQILRYGFNTVNNISHFFSYLAALFLGGGSDVTLTVIANANGFVNKGGGMSHIYFYYWFGYLGTIVFGLIIAKIINYACNHQNKIANILQIMIIIFLFRWFLYYPITFFRTAIIIPAILYVLCELFSNGIKNRRKG